MKKKKKKKKKRKGKKTAPGQANTLGDTSSAPKPTGKTSEVARC